MVHEGDGVPPRGGGRCGAGVIRRQQLHQCRRELFSGPPGSLGLDPVPLAILNGERPLQTPGEFEGLRRPAPVAFPRGGASGPGGVGGGAWNGVIGGEARFGGRQ